MTKTFIFTRQDKEDTISAMDVLNIKKETEELRKVFSEFKINLIGGSKPKDFKVIIDKVSYKIPAYWVLIGIVKDWYFEQGNIYTKEQVSEMFKHLAGHTQILNSVEVSRSIATNSNCTWQDMNKLLKYIIAFGEENGIVGCNIKEKERDLIKNSFEK